METQATKELNQDLIKELAKSSETATGIFKDLASRQRHRHDTDLTRYKTTLVREGVRVVEEDYEKTWKALQEMGAGSIVYGRRGNPNRFKWHYSLIDIGNMAFADKEAVVAKNRAEQTEVKRKRGRPVGSKNRKVRAPRVRMASANEVHLAKKTLYIPIRTNQGVEIVIPSDLNKQEAQVLSNALMQIAKSA